MYYPVTRYSNWAEYDQLNGKTLEEGEVLNVIWPDGTRDRVIVTVKTDAHRILEQGGYYTIKTAIAYVKSLYFGQEVLVPLLGVQAERA